MFQRSFILPAGHSSLRSVGWGILGLVGFLGIFTTQKTTTTTFDITYHYKHYILLISAPQQTGWMSAQEMWAYNGKPIAPPQEFRVDGDKIPPLPAGFKKSRSSAYDREAISATIHRILGGALNRPAGSVTIGKTSTGVTFDGIGLSGREVDLDAATDLTITALENRVSDVFLPVMETPPKVTVTSDELRNMGIKEFVTVGESDFSNSPANRRHNIAVGLSKFQGHIIAKDEIFSFDKVLGPVDGRAGYLKELVIKGEQTIPDYGGGLCQVSTTAYRGIWEYGFPITQRKNHSYMVNHYSPQGTDATVYPPNIDMKFKNDSPGALLLQTHSEGDLAYFIYYGTKDERKSQV